MHMYNAEKNEWSAPPPTYECIGGDKESNLTTYMTIKDNEIQEKVDSNGERDSFGTIYSLPQLKARFGVK